jgi:hypothetical protein
LKPGSAGELHKQLIAVASAPASGHAGVGSPNSIERRLDVFVGASDMANDDEDSLDSIENRARPRKHILGLDLLLFGFSLAIIGLFIIIMLWLHGWRS